MRQRSAFLAFWAPQVFGQGSEVNCLLRRLPQTLLGAVAGEDDPGACRPHRRTQSMLENQLEREQTWTRRTKPKNPQSLNQTTVEPKSPPRTGENQGESQSRCESLSDLTATLKDMWPMLRDPTLDKNLTYPMQFGDQYQRVSRPRPQPHFNDYQHWDSPC